LPLVFLVFPGMILLKLLDNPAYVWPALSVIAVFLLWALLRILKGVSVLYDVSPTRAYALGLLFCIVCTGIWVLYYDAVYSLTAYVEFMLNMARSAG
jgi:hypothetical protein